MPRARLVILSSLMAVLALAVPAVASAAVRLAPAGTAATGSVPGPVVTADFNSDGRLDVATPEADDDTVGVLLNATPQGAPTATFSSRTSFAVGAEPVDLITTDVDGDGLPDLITANRSADTISVLLNTTAPGATTPTFDPAQDYPTGGAAPTAITAFSYSGSSDLIVANAGETDASIQILTNFGGGYDPPQPFSDAPNPIDVTTGSLGGGGILGSLPVVVVANQDGTIDVLGSCGCGGSPTITPPSPASAVSLADVDGDGNLDIVATLGSAGGVAVYRGNGIGSFQPQRDYALGGAGTAGPVALGRLDGDGVVDVLVPRPTDDAVVPLINSGTGTLNPLAAVPAGDGPGNAAIADLNDDGARDVVVTNRLVDALVFLFNAPDVQALGVGFGAVTTGTTGATLPVVFSNTGAAPVSVPAGALAVTGAAAPDFAVTADTCSASTVPAGQSCAVLVSFTPGADGARNAALELSTGNGGTIAAPLSGTGVAASTGGQGPAGPAGPTGPQGTSGADGATGPAGPAGPQGKVGPPGRSVVTKMPKTCTLVRGTRYIHCTVSVRPRSGCRMQGTLLRGSRVAATTPSLTCNRERVGLRWSGRRAPARGTYTLVITTKDRGKTPISTARTVRLR